MKHFLRLLCGYLSATSAFFVAGVFLSLLVALTTGSVSFFSGVFFLQVLALSAAYGATCPITFSVTHFVRLSIMTRLFLQTIVNYPLLIFFAWLFDWMDSDGGFYKLTTVYFFAGMAAALFVCLYYPRKYRFYNDKLNAYKKKAQDKCAQNKQ